MNAVKVSAWELCLFGTATFLTGVIVSSIALDDLKSEEAHKEVQKDVYSQADDTSSAIDDGMSKSMIRSSPSRLSIVSNVTSISIPPLSDQISNQSDTEGSSGTAESTSHLQEPSTTTYMPEDGMVYVCVKCIPKFKTIKGYRQHVAMKHNGEVICTSPARTVPKRRRGRPRPATGWDQE